MCAVGNENKERVITVLIVSRMYMYMTCVCFHCSVTAGSSEIGFGKIKGKKLCCASTDYCTYSPQIFYNINSFISFMQHFSCVCTETQRRENLRLEWLTARSGQCRRTELPAMLTYCRRHHLAISRMDQVAFRTWRLCMRHSNYSWSFPTCYYNLRGCCIHVRHH